MSPYPKRHVSSAWVGPVYKRSVWSMSIKASCIIHFTSHVRRQNLAKKAALLRLPSGLSGACGPQHSRIAGWSQTTIRPRSIQYPLFALGLLHPLHPPTSRSRPRPRGAGSEVVRRLRGGIAVVLSHPSGRQLRRSNGASNLGGGRVLHARIRHCCGVRFACRTDSPSCVCSSVWCLTRRYRLHGDARWASGSSARSSRLRAASFPAHRPDFKFSSACRPGVPEAVRRSRARQTESRVVGCVTGACQHRSLTAIRVMPRKR